MLSFLSPAFVIAAAGPWALAACAFIIFAESGLLIGFFLPGDSLVFLLGMVSASMTLSDSPVSGMPLWITCLIVSVAAFTGDQAGYETGKHSGNIRRIKSWVQGKNRNRIKRAQRFFDDYGSQAIILARFVSILRTFVPFIIGMTHFNHRRFIIANLVGAVIWGVALPSMGYALGRIPLISNHVEIVCLCIVLILILPLVFKAFTSWLSRSEEIETK